MGIRIHTAIGYGLDDIKTDKKGRLADERINPLGWLMANDTDADRTWTMEGFVKYVQHCRKVGGVGTAMMNLFFAEDVEEGEKGLPDFNDFVVWGSEYKSGNVLLLIPPHHRPSEYLRYDHLIDWMDAAHENKWRNSWHYYDRPIYPFENWMDRRVGEPIQWGVELARCILDRKQQILSPDSRLPSIATLWREGDRLAKKMGFAGITDAMANFRPIVPEEIRQLCRFLCLFEDESTILELRPMKYIYWG